MYRYLCLIDSYTKVDFLLLQQLKEELNGCSFQIIKVMEKLFFSFAAFTCYVMAAHAVAHDQGMALGLSIVGAILIGAAAATKNVES